MYTYMHIYIYTHVKHVHTDIYANIHAYLIHTHTHIYQVQVFTQRPRNGRIELCNCANREIQLSKLYIYTRKTHARRHLCEHTWIYIYICDHTCIKNT